MINNKLNYINMSKKDSRILNQQSGRYPFRVSEEYFDNLTARIMEQIPEEDAPAKDATQVDINRKRRIYRWISVASAASFVLIAAVTLKFIPLSTSTAKMEELVTEYTEDDYNEDLLTYTMADGMSVYGYLSGEDEE